MERRSADLIKASGVNTAQTGRTHDRTRPFVVAELHLAYSGPNKFFGRLGQRGAHGLSNSKNERTSRARSIDGMTIHGAAIAKERQVDKASATAIASR
jgi:hypothetical protein